MNKNRKLLIVFLAMLIIALGGYMLGASNLWRQARLVMTNPEKVHDQRTKIIIWHSFGSHLNCQLQKIFRQFEQSQDQYRIVDVNKSNYENSLTSAATAYRSHTQPNILLSYEVGSAMMINSGGAIIPFHELLTMTNTQIDTEDFLPAIRGYYSQDDQLMSFPFNSSSAVLFYNKVLFDKARIKTPPQTWQEFIIVSEKLRKIGHGCAMTTTHPEWLLLEQSSAWNDLPFASHDNGFSSLQPKVEFNNPKIRAILTLVKDANDKGYFMYGGRSSTANSLFTSGKCAMIMNSSSMLSDFSKIKAFKIGVSKIPYWKTSAQDTPQNTIIGGGALWTFKIDDKVKNKAQIYQGVAAFYKFLAQPEIQAQLAKDTGYVPVTQSAYDLMEKQGYYQQYPEAKVALDSLNNQPPKPYTNGIRLGNYPLIREVNASALEEIFAGKNVDIEKILTDASIKDNQLIEQFYQQNRK